MADDATMPELQSVETPDARQLTRYIEEMLLELAQMASAAGETALAASLAIAAIQAGSAADRQAASLS